MRALQTIAFVLILHQGVAQGRVRTVETDSGTAVLHYFTTGELSAIERMDTEDHWGRSIAYTKDGRTVFETQTRKVGGHARVNFSFHANGGISKAEVSDAPDGGIQWYRSTSTYDENGERTGFTEQGHDDDGLIPRPTAWMLPMPETPEVPPPQEVVQEQRLFVNEVYVTNGSGWPIEIKVEPKEPSPALQGSQFVLPVGETMLVGSYGVGETFVSPVQRMKITGTVTTRRGKQKQVGVLMMEKRQVDPERMAWFYHVMPSGGRVGFGF